MEVIRKRQMAKSKVKRVATKKNRTSQNRPQRKEMVFDYDSLGQLFRLMDDNGVSEIEWQKGTEKLRVSKGGGNAFGQMSFQGMPSSGFDANAVISHVEGGSARNSTETRGGTGSEPPLNLKEICSPLVGTFYRSPSPDADPYISEGSSVKKGEVLCIVEAMKLMNEIESEFSGKIVSILVENGQPVEYGEPLFLVEIN